MPRFLILAVAEPLRVQLFKQSNAALGAESLISDDNRLKS